MKPLYLGCCFMITAFGLAFLAMGLIPMRLFWYYPLDRHWALEVRPHGLAIDFYGRTLYAALLSALAFAFGRWLGGKRGGAISSEQALLWVSYGLAFIALAMCLIGYQIWPRPASPVLIPPWYVPR